MTRVLRYLWNLYIRVILACIGAFAALSLLLGQWLRIEFFNMYYEMLPMMLIIFMVIYSFNLTILYRNMALSFNCRRRDFFLGSQAGFVLTALGSNAIVWLAGALPGLLGLEYAFQEGERFFNGPPAFTQPPLALGMLAVSLLLQPVGAAVGCLYEKHKAASTVLLIVCMLLSIVGTVLLMFLGDGTIPFLPAVMGGILAALAVLAAVCEVYFWRSNLKATVR